MDQDNELWRAKWLFLAGAVFLISTIFAYQELVYLVFGHTVPARVTRTYEIEQTRYGIKTGTMRRTVEYEFTDPQGNRREGAETVSSTWPVPADGRTEVRCTAGADGRARLAGNVNWLMLSIFTGSVVMLGLVGYRFWCQVREEVQELERGRSRRRR